MRLLAAGLFTCLLLLQLPLAAPFESCSCTADDRSCSASISCPGGCIAYCPSGACRATCSKPGTAGGEIGPILMKPITLHSRKGSSEHVASELARITAMQVSFVPNDRREKFNLDAKDIPLWDVLETLSVSGELKIGGEDFASLRAARQSIVSGERMKVCIHNASAQSVVDEFAGISGLPIRITAGDPQTIVNLTVQAATLDEAMAQISEQTGVQITVR